MGEFEKKPPTKMGYVGETKKWPNRRIFIFLLRIFCSGHLEVTVLSIQKFNKKV